MRWYCDEPKTESEWTAFDGRLAQVLERFNDALDYREAYFCGVGVREALGATEKFRSVRGLQTHRRALMCANAMLKHFETVFGPLTSDFPLHPVQIERSLLDQVTDYAVDFARRAFACENRDALRSLVVETSPTVAGWPNTDKYNSVRQGILKSYAIALQRIESRHAVVADEMQSPHSPAEAER